MNHFDFLSSFRVKIHDPSEIISKIDALTSTDGLDVHFIPFGCVSTSLKWLDNYHNKKRNVNLVWQNGLLFCFLLKYQFREKGQLFDKEGYFYVLQEEEYKDSFVAFSVENSEFYHKAFLPLVRSFYPTGIMTFITHKKLRRLIDKFNESDRNYSLLIKRASQRLRFQQEDISKKVMPIVSWPSMSVNEAFQWIYEQNGWFESISIEVNKDFRTITSFAFTRQGILKANSNIELLFNFFIKPVLKTIHENIEFFNHRSRLERNDLSTRPIVIEYEDNQFSNVSENKRLIQSLRRMKSASISVLHGNPYVHLTVLDYYDGSVFDVWVLDSQKMILVPQLKASVAAIKRIVNHVFDNYAEGNLKNYVEGQ